MDRTSIILTLICERIEHGHPPTMTDIAQALGCSRGTAHTLVHGLMHKGYLEQAGTTRTITLTEQGLTHIGRI